MQGTFNQKQFSFAHGHSTALDRTKLPLLFLRKYAVTAHLFFYAAL